MGKKGQRILMHWLFLPKCLHTMEDLSMCTPKFVSTKVTFSSMQSYLKFLKTQRKVSLKIGFRRVLFSILRIITLLISIVKYCKHDAL